MMRSGWIFLVLAPILIWTLCDLGENSNCHFSNICVFWADGMSVDALIALFE